MVLRFGSGDKVEDVATLIAKKNFTKAIELIRAQLKSQRADSRLRMQLADVLAMAGRDGDAVQILLPLADEFANEGFAAKAVAVLKKIQKLDPGRRDIAAKLAEVIEQKQRHATVLPLTPPPSARGMEIGMEEIGFAPPSTGAVSVLASAPAVRATPAPAPATKPPISRFDEPDDDALDLSAPAGELDLGGVAPPAPAAKPAPPPAARPVPAAPRPPAAPARPAPAPVVDQDLFIEDPDLLMLEPEEPLLVPDEPPDTMTDNAFADELLGLVEQAFQGVPGGVDGVPMPEHDVEAEGGSQIVVSPLFKDFSVDEMVAVIQGLRLLTFETRQVILREGAVGDGMYMLTAGTCKVYVKNSEGKQSLVGELNEGAFFGEVAVLTGKPRTATVVAATHCELLELDRPTLDSITASHPHVREVLEQFARERTRDR